MRAIPTLNRPTLKSKTMAAFVELIPHQTHPFAIIRRQKVDKIAS